MHLIFRDQILMNIIQNAVYKLTTEGGTVVLSQINVLVDGHFGWYGFKKTKIHKLPSA